MNYPLTPTQTRIWFLQKLQPETALYQVSLAVQLTGPLNYAKLHQAVQQVGQQHAVLRAFFPESPGMPERWEVDEVTIELPLETAVSPTEVEIRLRELAKRPFSLQTAPLIRFDLVQQTPEQHTLLIVAHRLIADQTSLHKLVREIAECYAGTPGSEPIFEPQLTEAKTDLAYWQTQLADLPLLLELPFDYTRAARQTDRGEQVQFSFAADQIAQLRLLADQHDLPIETMLLALFKTLLYRYTGKTDIIVGGMADLGAHGINPTENEVALRTQVDPTASLMQFAQAVQQTRDAAFTHRRYPFSRLVEQIQLERDLSHTPIFQITFDCKPHQEPLQTNNVQWQPQHLADGLAAYDLSFACTLHEAADSACILTYNADLFAAATIERMAGHLQQLLAGVTAVSTTSLAQLPLLTPAELAQIRAWNSTTLPFDHTACMHQLFEQQVEKFGEQTAVSWLDQTLTYTALNGRANQLARHLQTMGVQPGDFVAVCMERTPDLVVSLFAILKTGAAYVPLDPEYPADRIQFMMNDSQARVVLTQEALQTRLPQHNAQVWMVDSGWPQLGNTSHANLDLPISSHTLAYIIYTSGSTGRPKGVAITHHNAVAMISWAQSMYSADELAGVLASTSVCFDLSVYEIFVPLAGGGSIILARNALHLLELPNRNQVTLINTVPSAMTALVRAEAVPAGVRVVNLAGEPLKDSLVQAIYGLGTVEKVYDLYGPSEDTTYSTWLRMEANVNKEPSVGRPIANTQAHVLDQNRQQVPIGVVGELYLGGHGVASGYLHRPELTAERFIEDFVGGNGRLYKTGDLVRYRPNGELDFLGRMDHQVKVRGYRIELGEIEARLNQNAAVENSVVMALPDAHGTLQVVAYIVLAAAQTITSEAVRQHLRQTLPEYMIPALFIFLDEMPLTPNGKINRRALPAPDQSQAQTETVYEPPTSETERCLAQIWQSLLSVKQVGLNDHFFHLGGHSLLATQLVSAIRSDLNVELSLLTIFDIPTLRALAAHVSKKLLDNVADEELALMLEELESLSEEEIELLLAKDS